MSIASPVDPSDLIRVIQAATAPVVLISAVGLLLLVLTNRLARIVDRTRLLAREVAAGERRHVDQLRLLRRRARLVRLAVVLSASTVVLIGILVTGLFLGAVFHIGMVRIAIGLFILAMLALVAAMLVFMRELFLALAALDLEVGGAP